jgi:hypothetical protein
VAIDDIANLKFWVFLKRIKPQGAVMSSDGQDMDRAKFLEALEKKKRGNAPKSGSKSGDSKVKGGQSSGSTQKMFRRKSGPS